MADCLVTKLKDSVSRNDLRKMGELRISVANAESPDYANRRIRISSDPSQTISCINGGSFADGSGTRTSADAAVNTSLTTLVLANGEYEVSVPIKYNLTYLEGRNADTSFNIDDFAWCNNLVTVYAVSTNNTGNLASLKNLPALVDIRISDQNDDISGDIANFGAGVTDIILRSENIYGNINSLIKNSSITRVDLSRSPNVVGSIEEFANGQAATRNIGDVRFDLVDTSVTFGGASITANNRHLYFGSSMDGQNPTASETAQGWCWR